MAPNKTTRGGISLRRRVTAWLAAILLVTMLSNGIATVVGQWAVRAFDALLADNAACYTVQDAIKDETQAFARYVRQPLYFATIISQDSANTVSVRVVELQQSSH